MPRVKTGKAYEVLNCRVPPGLTARISAHAELYNQRVGDVVAAALQAYFDETHVAPLETPAAQVVRKAQQHIADGLKLLGNVVQVARRASAGTATVSMTPQSDTNGVDVTPQPNGTPAYDITKSKLGKLCPGAHQWGNTGKTLLTINGSKCLLCEKERRARLRQAKRQAPEAPAD